MKSIKPCVSHKPTLEDGLADRKAADPLSIAHFKYI